MLNTRQQLDTTMGEDSLLLLPTITTTTTPPPDRRLEQAIVALKKGAQLLKYRQRGKPKFCPFRLSTDERVLIWYSGQNEKQLRLDSITKIIPGTVNFQRQPEPGKECQAFSIIYGNGESTLDLICKDKAQAECWLNGLRALVSRPHFHKPFYAVQSCRGAKSCINSPASYSQRKHNLGLSKDTSKHSQVRSLCGSPPRLHAERCLSDGLSCSSDSFHSSGTGVFSRVQTIRNVATPKLPYFESEVIEKSRELLAISDFQMGFPTEVWPSHGGIPVIEETDVLRDVLVWGEEMEGGKFRGGDRIRDPNDTQFDALLPRVLESLALLDIKNISFGGKHAALVTKQGEVFTWGEEKGGRLGHKINMDLAYPKLVEFLDGIQVESVSCGEYHTCAVTCDGDLYTWGGSGVASGLGEPRNKCQWLPHKVFTPFTDLHVSSVACGEWHTAIVSSSGQLYTYGDGTFGVLGHGNVQSMNQPKEVESLKGLKVKSVACGPWHTAALVDIMVDRSSRNSSSGKLFTWGDGDKGKLGHLDRERKLFPTCVAPLVDHDFVQVSCGSMLTVGLTSTGVVYTMGSAVHGQLGNPQADDKSIAIVEGKLKGEFVKSISSGSYHIAVVTSRGKVYTWGKGANGRLGLGDAADRNYPTLVQALSDRHVETVACGSSFTAAICLHKSVFSNDQSSCTECKMVFGFTKKKRNCYNCGFLFCRACCSKKVTNASLAPNKSKPSHVCDTCYNKLAKFTDSNHQLIHEDPFPKQSVGPRNAFADLKIDRGATLRQIPLISPRIYNPEFIGGKTLEEEGRNQQTLDLSSGPRWGQVQSPMLFSTKALSKADAPTGYSLPEHVPAGSKCKFPPARLVEDFSESEKMLMEEVQRLQDEANMLERKCQMKSERLQQYQERIEETWSLARDEAIKSKAAKEIIKALTVRLYKLSEKHSAVKEENITTKPADGVDMYLPQITPISTDASSLDNVDPMLFTGRIAHEVAVLKRRGVDNSCTSPILSNDTVSTTSTREHCNGSAISLDESLMPEAGPEQIVTETTKSEWVEHDEPGVYITITGVPNGQKSIKRVRFSRKRFSEKEAERWWEENQVRIHEKYDIQGIVSQNKSNIRS